MAGSSFPFRAAAPSPWSSAAAHWRELLVVAAAASLGLTLVALALPRTVSALLALPGQTVLTQLQHLQPVDENALESLVTSQRRATFWHPQPRGLTDLGLALLLKAERLKRGSHDWRVTMIDARRSLRAGLAEAPANPYAWTRLAYAESQLGEWSPEAVAALRLALLTAPYEPRLLLPRLRLAFVAWPHLAEDDQDLVRQQIRYAWETDRDRLVSVIEDREIAAVVRETLAANIDAVTDFDERLRHRRANAS